MCAKKNKNDIEFPSSRCINSHHSVERQRKIITIMFDISYTTASCSVFTAQRACASNSVSNLFAASDKPKTSSHLLSLKDPLLFSEREGWSHSSSFSSSLIGLSLHVIYSSAILNTYGITWVWKCTLWISGSGAEPCESNCEGNKGKQWRTLQRGNISKCLVWHKARRLPSGCPLRFCCCHVAPFCCQNTALAPASTTSLHDNATVSMVIQLPQTAIRATTNKFSQKHTRRNPTVSIRNFVCGN